MSVDNKALAQLPILESMVFITLAVKWAMACGVKDPEVYKQLKKHYFFDVTRQISKFSTVHKQGWQICVVGSKFPVFVGDEQQTITLREIQTRSVFTRFRWDYEQINGNGIRIVSAYRANGVAPDGRRLWETIMTIAYT